MMHGSPSQAVRADNDITVLASSAARPLLNALTCGAQGFSSRGQIVSGLLLNEAVKLSRHNSPADTVEYIVFWNHLAVQDVIYATEVYARWCEHIFTPSLSFTLGQYIVKPCREMKAKRSEQWNPFNWGIVSYCWVRLGFKLDSCMLVLDSEMHCTEESEARKQINILHNSVLWEVPETSHL